MSVSTNNAVSVIGAGAFGTALALAFARAGRDVLLYGRDKTRMAEMASTRQCGDALPGLALEASVTPSADLARAAEPGVIVMAVPTQNLRSASEVIGRLFLREKVILSAAKGIENHSGRFVTEIMHKIMGERHCYGVLSGPSFASDIGRGLPTAISIATADLADAKAYAAFLGSNGLRLYHTSDVRGVEIGGAAKNVLAIAAGIVAGMSLGESARAAMIARGFAELRRFADAFGGKAETLMGLSGLGDLLLTASSAQSRNFSLGIALGQGKSLAESSGGKLAEGAFTAAILHKMATGQHIEMPIVAAVADVLEGKISVRDAVRDLMARPMREE